MIFLLLFAVLPPLPWDEDDLSRTGSSMSRVVRVSIFSLVPREFLLILIVFRQKVQWRNIDKLNLAPMMTLHRTECPILGKV